ncbi:AbfB domain-containing protein, partial [Kibdelosporangium persicum]
AADERDAAREKALREEADRQKVREIKAKAEAGRVRPRLVAAANAALAGTAADVTRFLSETQYAVLNQALMTTTPGVKGWHVRTGGGDAVITPGTPSTTAGEAPLGEATWKVVTGLADAACYSFESATKVGSYLRQQDQRVKLHASDGSDVFKKDATWCPKLGHSGSGVSLESKALPGRFLRHYGAALYAANESGQNPWDTQSAFKTESTWSVVGPNPIITTQIMLRWHNDDAWRTFIGASKGAEVVEGGVRYKDFNNSRAYWSQATGVHNVWGPILTKFQSVGGHKWKLPVQDATGTPDGIGAFNHFTDGASIYWSPNTGAHLVYGAIRTHWSSLGWEKSYLGYPLEDEKSAGGTIRRSVFQNGNIDHDLSNGKTWDYRR